MAEPKIEKYPRVIIIPTDEGESMELTNFQDILDDKFMGNEFSRDLNHFHVNFLDTRILSNPMAQERAKEADLIIFIYNASQLCGSEYYKQFVENVRKFRPGNGGKTCFALYTPTHKGDIPELDVELAPTYIPAGAETSTEAFARAIIVAYRDLIKT